MRHVTRPLALMLAGTLSTSGCATAHLRGEYAPQPLASNTSREVASKAEKQNLAEGSDWVLFWGLVELASSNLGDEAKDTLRNDEQIRDPEIRNHLSLPGALLWIVTLGLVSHHDLVLAGQVETMKIAEPIKAPPPAPVATTAGPTTDRSRTVVIVNGQPQQGQQSVADSELFQHAVIDRPIDQVASNFNDAARKSNLIPISEIRWDELSAAKKSEMKSDMPENKLEGVSDSKIYTFIVTTDKMVADVEREPQCGAFVPQILCYEKDGKTNVFFSRPTSHLRQAELNGRVGEGRMMSRDQYDEHYSNAKGFERDCDKLVKELAAGPSKGKGTTEPAKEEESGTP